MPDPVVYPSWEQASTHPIPPRSYLYHLLPVGLGSAAIESLTSYLARLAAAHDISSGTLLTREILPKVREEFRRHDYRAVHEIESTFLYEAHTLNGVGQRSQDWVYGLERLTGVRGLQCLTMGAWRQVISGVGLLRRRRAWCPLCFDDWRCSNQPVYEPLLWALKEVSACPTHGCPLVDRCPHCGRDQHVISAKVKPGHCCRCRRWLGMKTAATDTPGDIGVSVALAESIGELVSIAPTLAQPPGCEALLHNLKLCIEELADGSMSRFVAATGVSFDTMADWGRLPGEMRPAHSSMPYLHAGRHISSAVRLRAAHLGGPRLRTGPESRRPKDLAYQASAQHASPSTGIGARGSRSRWPILA